MGTYSNFVRAGIVGTLAVIGEPASIGGNQFSAAFEESGMDVLRHTFGDEDEVTTTATCLKSELTNEPRIGETLIRIGQSKTYVITEVGSDVQSYTITLRAKNG